MKAWNDWSWMKGHVTWLEDNKEYLGLTYSQEDFNDTAQIEAWKKAGFTPRTGWMYDMRHTNQPSLTKKLIEYAGREGLENVGVSYYCMWPGDNLPYHSDTYKKYISLFHLESRKQNILRYIFFPENRQDGHIFEIDGRLIDWKAGDWVAWKYDTPHMAANLGTTPRFTIQVTGVLRDSK